MDPLGTRHPAKCRHRLLHKLKCDLVSLTMHPVKVSVKQEHKHFPTLHSAKISPSFYCLRVFETCQDSVNKGASQDGIKILFANLLKLEHAIGLKPLPASAFDHAGSQSVRLSPRNTLTAQELFVQVLPQSFVCPWRFLACEERSGANNTWKTIFHEKRMRQLQLSN